MHQRLNWLVTDYFAHEAAGASWRIDHAIIVREPLTKHAPGMLLAVANPALIGPLMAIWNFDNSFQHQSAEVAARPLHLMLATLDSTFPIIAPMVRSEERELAARLKYETLRYLKGQIQMRLDAPEGRESGILEFDAGAALYAEFGCADGAERTLRAVAGLEKLECPVTRSKARKKQNQIERTENLERFVQKTLLALKTHPIR